MRDGEQTAFLTGLGSLYRYRTLSRYGLKAQSRANARREARYSYNTMAAAVSPKLPKHRGTAMPTAAGRNVSGGHCPQADTHGSFPDSRRTLPTASDHRFEGENTLR
ncbi:MAG: hypothetical protein V8T86_13070 [Victivallis sp.]